MDGMNRNSKVDYHRAYSGLSVAMRNLELITIDMELKMDHVANDMLVTLERVSWSRGNIAYARLSATMKRLGLIDVILEYAIDDIANDWWHELGVNQREI